MYIGVVDDIFDISNRIKEIDDGYFVLYNCVAKNFEIHNNKQKDTFCISSGLLDAGVIKKLHASKTVNLDRVLKEIDENNRKIADKSQKNSLCEAKEKFDEIMRYIDSGKHYDPEISHIQWR